METVNFQLIHIDTDKERLHGLISEVPNCRGTVVHVHGTWGNFYGNPFIVPIAAMYRTFGLSFAAVNFPGHDETAINERLEDFGPALSQWLTALNVTGPIILQGHSLGAVKIASLMSEGTLPNGTVGAVLLAPFDVVAFYSRSTSGDISALHSELSQLIESHQQLVPSKLFDFWMMAPQTVMDATTVGGVWDQFPTSRSDPGRALRNATFPIFVAVGTDDFAATPNPEKVIRTFGTAPTTEAALVQGAPHNFANREAELADYVKRWFEANIPLG